MTEEQTEKLLDLLYDIKLALDNIGHCLYVAHKERPEVAVAAQGDEA